jgi:hypothetical protein
VCKFHKATGLLLSLKWYGSFMTYSAKDTAGGLQLAIWKTLFPDIEVNPVQEGGDGDIWAVYDATMKDNSISELTEGFYVAFKEGAEGVKGRQDQLFKQVPETAAKR